MPTYPLYDNDAATLRTATGRPLSDVTLDTLAAGELSLDDLQIHRSALVAQADIAHAAGYTQLAANLRRAAEMTVIPRAEIIEMYQLALAARLETVYAAPLCAALVREAAAVYVTRGMLRHPEAL
jgi:propanediol dehydratase small subunit